MKEGTRHLLEKAERAIQAADVLLAGTGAEFAAGRALAHQRLRCCGCDFCTRKGPAQSCSLDGVVTTCGRGKGSLLASDVQV